MGTYSLNWALNQLPTVPLSIYKDTWKIYKERISAHWCLKFELSHTCRQLDISTTRPWCSGVFGVVPAEYNE